jgi:hypothetical protein
MWVTTKLILAGAVTLFLFQNTDARSSGKAGASIPAAADKDSAGAVGPTEPVITVHGVCEDGKKAASGCTTVIAREQFESLVHALHPGQDLPTTARNNLAKLYAEYLVVEAATRKAGMEDTAEFREFMNWMRVLAASEYYRRKLQEKYSSPSENEIHAFYEEHRADYETVHLLRVVVPRENRLGANEEEFDKRAHEAIRAAREDLAKGMDPAEVQIKAYRTLGLDSPPPIDLGNRHRKDFLAEEVNEVFSLNQGDATQVLTETRNYVIYKILSKETTSEADLKKNISAQLTDRKFKETMKSVLDGASVDLNEKYFGTPTATPETPTNPHSTPGPKK